VKALWIKCGLGGGGREREREGARGSKIEWKFINEGKL